MEELSALEKDTIGEVGNISLGSSATTLSVILDKFVDITTPKIDVINFSDIQHRYPVPCLAVEVNYRSGLQGSNMLLIKEEDAVIISSLMMGEPYEGKEGPLNEMELSAVQEAMNQMMGSMATSMSELFQRPIEISPPVIERINLSEEIKPLERISDIETVVKVEFTMKVAEIIDSIMVQIIPVDFAKKMSAELLGEESGSAPVAEDNISADPEAAPGPDTSSEAPGLDQSEIDETIKLSETETNQSDPSGLTDMEKDTIAEVGNISLGSSATALSELLNKAVDITTPKLNIVKVGEIQEKYPIPCVLVDVDYVAGLQGSNMLMVKKNDALIIAALMMGEPHEGKEGDLTEIELSAVQEAMNQMMGSMATSMSDLFQRPIDISPPSLEVIDLADDRVTFSNLDPEDLVVHVEFTIKVEDIIDSVMFQVVPLNFAREMAGNLLYGAEGPASEKSDTEPKTEVSDAPAAVGEQPSTGPGVEDDTFFGQGSATREPQKMPGAAPKLPPSADLQKLELVRDIPMDITVVLGSTRMPLGELFSLNRGGIVDLDCNANDPVEIMANDRLLAKGELVMIKDQLGVKITEIQFEEVIESYGI